MAAGEGEATTCHKRSAPGQEEEESKRPRDGSEEEEELLTDLSRYRRYWTDLWSDVSGDIAKRTEFGPMRYTEEPVPPFAKLQDLLEVFSFEVTELKDVFGLISVRDSLDRNRWTGIATISLSAPGTTARLSLQSRAVQLIDPIEFEIELRVKGTSPSKDKILSAEAFGYNCIAQRLRCGSLRSMMLSGARSTLEFKYAHIPLALEATIKVRITRGSTDFCGKFIAHTASIKEDVILLDSGEEMVAISHDGAINFSRSVVAVEGNGGVLTVGVHARQSGGENMRCSYKEFIPVRCGRSHDTLDVGFCQMSVEVAWSLIF
uniref:DUF6598 domain-containing protein n=1 Tax=Oryza barthii TaxID=65489 RepID=A0A0D3HVB6_9ORYZ